MLRVSSLVSRSARHASVSALRATARLPIFATRPLAQFRTMKTLTEAIKEDHDEMYEYYTAYKKAFTAGDLDTAAKFSNQLRWEVARHAVGEELVVYPLMEEKMGAKGKELADHDRAEHQDVKEMLQTLDGLDISSPEYDGRMHKLMEHLKHHNDEEENDDLPQLEPTLGKDGSISAAQSFSKTKKFVPTRTHPALPNLPPYETLAGFLVAPIDKLRDYFLSWPSSEQKEEAEKAYEQGGGRSQLDV